MQSKQRPSPSPNKVRKDILAERAAVKRISKLREKGRRVVITIVVGFGLKLTCCQRPEVWLCDCLRATAWEQDSKQSRVFYFRSLPPRWQTELKLLRGLLVSNQWPFLVNHLPLAKLYSQEQRCFLATGVAPDSLLPSPANTPIYCPSPNAAKEAETHATESPTSEEAGADSSESGGLHRKTTQEN
jgi:hypothetical protein